MPPPPIFAMTVQEPRGPRDLKPAKIKVRPDGTAKVLDFGLAKAMEPGYVASPAMTAAGIILGTAAHMSPEQKHHR